MDSLTKFLAEYQASGGSDPLVFRLAIPMLLPRLIKREKRRGHRQKRPAHVDIRKWLKVETARRDLIASGKPFDDKALFKIAGVSRSAYYRAKDCSLVKMMLGTKEIFARHPEGIPANLVGGADEFWWIYVNALADDLSETSSSDPSGTSPVD